MTGFIFLGLYIAIGVFAFRVCIKSMMMSETVYDWDDSYDVSGITLISIVAGFFWPGYLLWMFVYRACQKQMKKYQEAGY